MTLIEELKSKAGWHGHEHISGLLLKAAKEIESLQKQVLALKVEYDKRGNRGYVPAFDGEGNEIGEQPCHRCGGT